MPFFLQKKGIAAHCCQEKEVAPVTRKSTNHMPPKLRNFGWKMRMGFGYLVAMISSLHLLPSPPVAKTKVDHLTMIRKIKINTLSAHTHTPRQPNTFSNTQSLYSTTSVIASTVYHESSHCKVNKYSLLLTNQTISMVLVR